MIIDTHTHVVSSDKVKHPLDPGARGWSTEVSNDVEDLIAEMDDAGVECATLVQPNATYALDNTYQCDSANQYAPRTVSVGILDPAAPDAADNFGEPPHGDLPSVGVGEKGGDVVEKDARLGEVGDGSNMVLDVDRHPEMAFPTAAPAARS